MANPDWPHFPSLTALRAFEATARLEGFSAAARVLNVTHAAVAQQVRSLEAELGAELVFREGRRMSLTATGTKLAATLSESFRAIETAVNEVKAVQPGAPLRVTMTPAFAAQWLMPRLGTFWADHPDVPLSLHPDKRVIDLRREGIDLAIRFGDGKWPGLQADYLTSAKYIIVGAPNLLGGRTALTKAEMSAMPWVIEQDWPEALAWLRGFGLKPDVMQITYIPTEELALSAARQGYGLHVESAALVEEDLQYGDLVALGELQDDSLAYYLVTRPGPQKPELKTFVKWLKSRV